MPATALPWTSRSTFKNNQLSSLRRHLHFCHYTKLYPFITHFIFYILSSPYHMLHYTEKKFHQYYNRLLFGFVFTSARTLQHELASANTNTHTLPLMQKQPWTWLINKQAGPSKGGRNLHRPCLAEEKSDAASQASALAAAAAAQTRCFSWAVLKLYLKQGMELAISLKKTQLGEKLLAG